MLKHGNVHFDREYYRRFHKEYSEGELERYYRWFSGWIRFLDRYLPLRDGQGRRVLEIGCSIGAFAKLLQERGFEVTATDISSFIIKKAKRLQNGVDFRTLNIEKGITIPGNFDYIFAFEVLEHLKNPQDALVNVREKLKKGGTFVFSTPFPSRRSLADPTHINVHEPGWWINKGGEAGFSKRKLVYAAFVPFLYRLHKLFSVGFPIKVDLPYINSTCIFFFEK